MSDNGLFFSLIVSITIIALSVIAAMFAYESWYNPELPNCTEDEVIAYRNFDDPDTLFCLHIDDIYGLQPTPVASSMREGPR